MREREVLRWAMLTEEWASRGVRGLQSPGPRWAASSSTLGSGMRGTWCSASQQEVTHALEEQDPRSTLSSCLLPPPPPCVAGSQAEHQLISIFSLFLLCFRLVSCLSLHAPRGLCPLVPCAFLAWCLPSHLPPTHCRLPWGWGGQHIMPSCRTWGRGAASGPLLSTGSDLPLCLVGPLFPVPLGPLPVSLSFVFPFFSPHVSTSSCLSASSLHLFLLLFPLPGPLFPPSLSWPSVPPFCMSQVPASAWMGPDAFSRGPACWEQGVK